MAITWTLSQGEFYNYGMKDRFSEEASNIIFNYLYDDGVDWEFDPIAFGSMFYEYSAEDFIEACEKHFDEEEWNEFLEEHDIPNIPDIIQHFGESRFESEFDGLYCRGVVGYDYTVVVLLNE